MTTFRSRHHPKGRPTAVVYGAWLVRPLAATVIPVMIAATAAVLTFGDVFPYVAYGFPAAVALATGWTRFRLAGTPAALHVRGGQAALQSVWDVLRRREPTFHPILDARLSPTATQIALGWDTRTLDAANWPEHDALQSALQDARGVARALG